MRTIRIPNGQAAMISADGQYVIYGNQTVGLLNRKTGEFRNVCEGYPGGWVGPNTPGITSFEGVSNNEYRWFYHLDPVTGVRVRMDIPESTKPLFAENGHVYGIMPGKQYDEGIGMRYFRDGLEIPIVSAKPLFGFQTDGKALLTNIQEGLSPNFLWDVTTGALIRQASLDGLQLTWQHQRNAKLFSGPDGPYVFQGAQNGMWVNTPANINFQVPQLIDDGAVSLHWYKGVMYAVTIRTLTFDDYLVIIRPADGSWGRLSINVVTLAHLLAAKIADAGEIILAGTHPGTNELRVVDDLWMDQAVREDPAKYLTVDPPVVVTPPDPTLPPPVDTTALSIEKVLTTVEQVLLAQATKKQLYLSKARIAKIRADLTKRLA